MLRRQYDGWKGVFLRVGEERGESLWWNDLKKVCGGGGSLNWFDEGMSWEIGEGECKENTHILIIDLFKSVKYSFFQNLY